MHELAEAFKCKSESLDYEPKRNVVVTAEKGVSKHPTPLLSDAILEKPVSQKSASPKPARKGWDTRSCHLIRSYTVESGHVTHVIVFVSASSVQWSWSRTARLIRLVRKTRARHLIGINANQRCVTLWRRLLGFYFDFLMKLYCIVDKIYWLL